MRPLRRVAADRPRAFAGGTPASSTSRMLPLFEPLRDAILAHRNEAALALSKVAETVISSGAELDDLLDGNAADIVR